MAAYRDPRNRNSHPRRTHPPSRSPWWKRLSNNGARILGAVALATVTALAVAFATNAVNKASDKKAPEIQVADLTVQVPDVQGGIIKKNGFDADFKPVILDIKVHNAGKERGIIKGAVITIRDYVEMRVCAGQSDVLESSATYAVTLPAHPKPGRKVDVHLSQEVGPDEVDRFQIALRVDEAALGDESTGSLFAYHMGLKLVLDAQGTEVNAGNAVAILRQAITRQGDQYFLTRSGEAWTRHAVKVAAYDPEEAIRCMEANNAKLNKVASMDGAKPDWLSVVQPDLTK